MHFVVYITGEAITGTLHRELLYLCIKYRKYELNMIYEM